MYPTDSGYTQRALRLASMVGMPVRFVSWLEWHELYPAYSWDGHVLTVMEERRPDEVEHEVLHFVEARGSGREHLPEFGLGHTPYEGCDESGADLMAVYKRGHGFDADRAEVATCLLQIWLNHALGGPWRQMLDWYNFDCPVSWSFDRMWDDNDHVAEVSMIERSGALDTVRRFARKEKQWHGRRLGWRKPPKHTTSRFSITGRPSPRRSSRAVPSSTCAT